MKRGWNGQIPTKEKLTPGGKIVLRLESKQNWWRSISMTREFFFIHLPPEFIPVSGQLTWWCASTLGAALLCSSRAGSWFGAYIQIWVEGSIYQMWCNHQYGLHLQTMISLWSRSRWDWNPGLPSKKPQLCHLSYRPLIIISQGCENGMSQQLTTLEWLLNNPGMKLDTKSQNVSKFYSAQSKAFFLPLYSLTCNWCCLLLLGSNRSFYFNPYSSANSN